MLLVTMPVLCLDGKKTIIKVFFKLFGLGLVHCGLGLGLVGLVLCFDSITVLSRSSL